MVKISKLFQISSSWHWSKLLCSNVVKFGPRGNWWNRAILTRQKKTKFRQHLTKYSRLKSAPDFIQIGSLSAEIDERVNTAKLTRNIVKLASFSMTVPSRWILYTWPIYLQSFRCSFSARFDVKSITDAAIPNVIILYSVIQWTRQTLPCCCNGSGVSSIVSGTCCSHVFI